LSDKTGRKPFLYLSTLGYLIQVLSLVLIEASGVNILVLHISGFVNGCCGFLPGIVTMLTSYLTDIVPADALPLRIGEVLIYKIIFGVNIYYL